MKANMDRDQIDIRDRLVMLSASECSNPNKPINIKRKTLLNKQHSSKSGQKMNMQDFIRMDPNYTTNIEHLVFPGGNKKNNSPQQVATKFNQEKSRSQLAEMYALSRHLQQRSVDSRGEIKPTKSHINRSVDSVLETRSINTITDTAGLVKGKLSMDNSKIRWVNAVEEPVRQSSNVSSSRLSPSTESEMTTARGSNISILHVRNTSEPSWDVSPTSSIYQINNSTKSSSSNRKTNQSYNNQLYNKRNNSSNFHSGDEINSTELFIGETTYNRELSPVRWCDREVDGVYLGRSGWVQVQQRSLDENRHKQNYSTPSNNSLQFNRKSCIKLSDYHCNSEPSSSEIIENQRPIYLSLQTKSFEHNKSHTPSPSQNIPESFSPPSITPIISPPPAFQDNTNNKKIKKEGAFFGKTPFLPRSNAIIDSDQSPPTSPISNNWKTFSSLQQFNKNTTCPIITSQIKKINSRIPQTKSLEDTTTSRRSKFIQRYGESSSSSSSSMGFRSLDSCMSRTLMPRLSENTDSSLDVYEDADEEDNNSSSLNVSVVSSNIINDFNRSREKNSNRLNTRTAAHYRSHPNRRSPAGSDTNKSFNCTSPDSSSSSSSSTGNEFLSRTTTLNTSSQQLKRSTNNRLVYPKSIDIVDETSLQRVRRSKSLQLSDKKLSTNVIQNRISPPQHSDVNRTIKVGNSSVNRLKKRILQPPRAYEDDDDQLDEDMIKEVEAVTEYLYGNRSKAAAQALLMQRYKDNTIKNKESQKGSSKPPLNPNEFTVYFVGNGKQNKQNIRNLTKNVNQSKNSCNSDTCDFWPHCANRDSLNRSNVSNFLMKSSQSYPSHQKSLDLITNKNNTSGISSDYNNQDSKIRKSVQNEKCSSSSSTNSKIDNSNFKTHDHYKTTRKKHEQGTNVSFENRTLPISNLTKLIKSSTIGDNYSSNSDAKLTNKSNNKFNKSLGLSIPLMEMTQTLPDNNKQDEIIFTRPGSAPTEESNINLLESQQRSMSLPKSFLSANYQQGGHLTYKETTGTESLGSSPGSIRKIKPKSSHTAPVTPLHEGGYQQSSQSNASVSQTKALSSPQLLNEPNVEKKLKWLDRASTVPNKSKLNSSDSNRNLSESVLRKFKKSFSLRFQKKNSKDSFNSDVVENLSEPVGEPSEEESEQILPNIDINKDNFEQKSKFGPLSWRSSKERKKLNKAARNAKCNSGDSGIQIEMVPSSSYSGAICDSSESHDTDTLADDLDSPPIRRRSHHHSKVSRPHSDLLNQILIDKFKSDLKQLTHKHQQVRRTRSDLGGQRLLNWETKSPYYKRLMSSPIPLRSYPQSPKKKLENADNHIQYGQLRRSLSQPIDIDKLSPLMRMKTLNTKQDKISSDEEMIMSGSESSITSLNEQRKKSLELAMDEEIVILAEAVFDHVAIEAEELAFRAGDVIEVLETANRDWWWGTTTTNNKSGWFPSQFVRLRVSQEDTVEDCLAAMASGINGNSTQTQIRRRTSISLLSNDQVRTSIVRELVHTERDFVKVLQDVAEGYINECRKRKDMFNNEQINTIFINLEDILKFQSNFLKDLENCIDWEAPYKSCVGQCFLKHQFGFKMYSDYCNSHPIATATLQELYQFNNYNKFFEACRLMRGLIEIPLHGYLLTPVQRICKYPLQLAELLKYTKIDHVDYNNIKEALNVMKDVAVLINERKRRMESLEKLAAWQQRVEGWEDEDLIEVSSQLIYQGEVVRVTSGMWTNNITLFLFDHQIVYCKKDILKRNTYIYKGRMCLDTSEVIDVPDGKDIHLGINVRHAIKLYSCIRDKWLLFCCRSKSEKQKWLEAFTEERRLVIEDKNNGLEFPPAARQLARIAARCQKRPPYKFTRGNKNYNKQNSSNYNNMGSSLHLNSNSLGRKVGTWFTFRGGANKKASRRRQDFS